MHHCHPSRAVHGTDMLKYTCVHICRAVWQDPVAGMSSDTFTISDDGNTLWLRSDFKRNSSQRELGYTIVYKRKK